jgi:hypothetical protein
MKQVATIILNRNLPAITDALCEHILRFDGDCTDVFVVEAGSDPDRLSKYVSWYADWPDARENGLRYFRGMNYGLSKLYESKNFNKYSAFFLLTNDAEFAAGPIVSPLLEVLSQHPRVGLLSPCSSQWGEQLLLQKEKTKYFWYIHNVAYLLRREFIESVMNESSDPILDFLFDGNNFRGYGAEQEIIAKAYANDFAAAITNTVCVEENERHLMEHAELIKTDAYEKNLELYIEEGFRWMRKKYGFNSRWTMQQYVKSFYDNFFYFHPEYIQYKI